MVDLSKAITHVRSEVSPRGRFDLGSGEIAFIVSGLFAVSAKKIGKSLLIVLPDSVRRKRD